MPKLSPKYAENIIVAVIYRSQFHWYVTEKDIWFMDMQKWKEAFLSKGYSLELDMQDEGEDLRRNFPVLDTNNISEWLKELEPYRTSTKELRNMMEIKIQIDDEYYYDFYPSLYLNFDEKKLLSFYPEPAAYEQYVTDGWTGEYQDFLEQIPQSDKFWHMNGHDYLDNQEVEL